MKNRARLARYVMHEGEFIMCREVETRGVVCAARCANPEHSRPICLFGFERVFRRYCDIEMSSSYECMRRVRDVGRESTRERSCEFVSQYQSMSFTQTDDRARQ